MARLLMSIDNNLVKQLVTTVYSLHRNNPGPIDLVIYTSCLTPENEQCIQVKLHEIIPGVYQLRYSM